MSLPQDTLLTGAGWRAMGLKWKVELDVEEVAQPKQLKQVVKVVGMRGEPTTWEVLLEQLELFKELQDLQARHLEVMEKHLEEVKGAHQLISVIRYTLEELVECMSRLEERSGSRSGSPEIRSI